MKRTIIVFLLLASSVLSRAQSEVNLQIQLLTPDQIAEVTLDKEPFYAWVQEVNSIIETQLKEESGDFETVVLFTLHPDEDATIIIGAKPQLPEESYQELSRMISNSKAPRTKFADFSFAIIATVNNGCEEEMDYSPSLTFPLEREIEAFEGLELSEKKEALQSWVDDEVIPILAHYETAVDPKFEGVMHMGELLENKKYQNKEIERLTDKNTDYWRATLEMSKGNQLIPFTKVCLHISKGQFDRADRLLFVVDVFSDESSLPALFYPELSRKLDLLNKDLEEEILAGIALHDKEQYKKAVKHYENLLKIIPHSAWLNYELYYSKAAEMELEETKKFWEKSKQAVYAADPMYPMDIHAETGKEGYLLFRRQKINELFKSNEDFKSDFIEYADIAFDLGNYSFAAQLYWLIVSYFPEEDYQSRNIIAYFLYCLDQLGDDQIIKNFEGDFEEEFAKIEKERQKIMEESTIYNSFQKKE